MSHSLWSRFDSAWILAELERAGEHGLEAKLRSHHQALLKESPQPGTLIYYFHDPLSHGWAVAASKDVVTEKAEFLFNFLPGGGLGALHVRMKA